MNASGVIGRILAGDQVVTDLVGDRIYPVMLPQSVPYPAILITVVDDEPNDTKSGPATEMKYRIQVDCYDKSMGNTATIMDHVRRVIDKFAGNVKEVDERDYFVSGIRYITTNQTFEDDKEVFRTSQDYYLRFKQTK